MLSKVDLAISNMMRVATDKVGREEVKGMFAGQIEQVRDDMRDMGDRIAGAPLELVWICVCVCVCVCACVCVCVWRLEDVGCKPWYYHSVPGYSTSLVKTDRTDRR